MYLMHKDGSTIHLSVPRTPIGRAMLTPPRYYNQAIGRFTSMDDFAGTTSDPTTLHKYAYCGGDPANRTDPSGHFFMMFTTMLGYSATILRYALDPGRSFEGTWGLGRELAKSMDYDVSDPFALAGLHQASQELQLMDVVAEARRGLAATANATQLMWDAIHETFDLNEQILMDLIISPFFASACFAAGTPVVVGVNPDGTYITKAIEDVQSGDSVLARDERDPEAPTQLRRVEAVFSRETDYARVLTVRDDRGTETSIRTTDGHLIWVAGRGWTRASDLKIGDRLCDAGGRSSVTVLASEREDLPEPIRVYTFRVEADHTYFVSDAVGTGRLTAWVHNVCAGAAAYEEAMRADKGVAGQARAQRGYPIAGKMRYTDAKFIENGVTVAGEAKYVGNWAESIYNPASNVGGKGFAGAVRRGVVKQCEDYLAGGFGKVVLRTNSQEFINHYSQEFAKASILNRVTFELKP